MNLPPYPSGTLWYGSAQISANVWRVKYSQRERHFVFFIKIYLDMRGHLTDILKERNIPFIVIIIIKKKKTVVQ